MKGLNERTNIHEVGGFFLKKNHRQTNSIKAKTDNEKNREKKALAYQLLLVGHGKVIRRLFNKSQEQIKLETITLGDEFNSKGNNKPFLSRITEVTTKHLNRSFIASQS